MILAFSPHLDDAIFSVGGYLYDLARQGHEVLCLTVFTKSVPDPKGFALACQLDKGLGPAVDYMALRRREDSHACSLLGVGHLHWKYPEAPHRGYDSAADLFTGIRRADTLDKDSLRKDITAMINKWNPHEILYPFGAGNHVDHLQLVDIIGRLRPLFPMTRFRQYYDMPYAQKFRENYPELGVTVPAVSLEAATYAQKIRACAAYESQVTFQFGGAEQIGDALGNSEYLI